MKLDVCVALHALDVRQKYHAGAVNPTTLPSKGSYRSTEFSSTNTTSTTKTTAAPSAGTRESPV